MNAAPDHVGIHSAPAHKSPEYSFKNLVRKERAWIDGEPEPAPTDDEQPAGFLVSKPGIADEPWICFSPRDSFGIALSGGGIRSATFNIGLLQALEQKGLIDHADYLSTVSGGGYAGGFLSSWGFHHPETPSTFPSQNNPEKLPLEKPEDTREPAAIRHLREFSRFLMPRLGLFHMETWGAVVTILSGLVPALFTACALLALVVGVWVVLIGWLSVAAAWSGGILMGGLTFLAQAVSERNRFRQGKAGENEISSFIRFAALVSAVVGFVWWGLATLSGMGTTSPGLFSSLEKFCGFWTGNWLLIWTSASSAAASFTPSAVWLIATALLLSIRAVSVRFIPAKPNWSATMDRVIAMCLGLALAWAAMALLWAFCLWLLSQQDSTHVAGSIGGGAVATGGLFAWLRDWLTKPTEQTRATTITEKITEVLRPKIPQLLAIAAVLLLLAGVCVGVQSAAFAGQLLLTLGVSLGVIAFTLLFFDPARVGMHDFYRSRICRCFLGAGRADIGTYRRTCIEQPDDDVRMKQLREAPGFTRPTENHPKIQPRRRPFHLVCCTANNLSGDVLASLYRGSRSAVVSAHGIALGDLAAPLDDLRLSSALTASAAAFNSQMGRLSMDFGPAVGFLMSAMNLRLGLWVPHPLNPRREHAFLPGLPFFYEMLGISNCDLPPQARAEKNFANPAGEAVGAIPENGLKGTLDKLSDSAKKAVGDSVKSAGHRVENFSLKFHDLHLSDGGHFENLALYELVRRHCRYIIVSDCGADPEIIFDDLAIALRTIREDFGVEIDLDVSPLRPGEAGRSRQHAVVGTIHYDGLKGLDKGTLLYFKPTLTGDEPPDVLQYRSRNPAFPHESTGDQFYDEPQWESYRRLGQHAGNSVLQFIENYTAGRRGENRFVENVFLDAARHWHPALDRQGEVFLTLTQRCADLENDIRQNAPASLRAEFFPEVTAVLAAAGATSTPTPSVDEETQKLYYLMLIAQVMEDVWLGAELDTYWSHPLNDGWMNYFHRWASTPSFRRWWPVLRPIFGIGFRDFVRDRFDLAYHDAEKSPTAGAKLTASDPVRQPPQVGLAWDYWQRRSEPSAIGKEKLVIEYRMSLDPGVSGLTLRDFPVGLLVYLPETKPDGRTVATWRNEDFFVPASLNGAGIKARFLETVVKQLQDAGGQTLCVVFDQEKSRPDPASRLRQLHEINFYKSRGFVYEEPAGQDPSLRLYLRPKKTPTV